MTGRDDRAIRYLLDELPEPDREAFEDDYFGDEDTYGTLLAAEDDLIDLYCEGGLTEERRARFEERYLATEEGRQRVEFARALKTRAAEHAQPPPGQAARAGAMLRWLPWAAVLAVALTAAVFATLQATDARRAREERAALQERLAHQQQRSREQDRRLAEMGQQLSRVQEQARAVEDLLGAAAAHGLRAAALVLDGGLRRGTAALPRLTLTPDVNVVRLRLRVQEASRAAYRATLQTAEGRELWARDGLLPARADGSTQVTFTVPAAVLAPGHYVVILGPAGARGEPDAEFVFEARRADR